MSVTIPSDAPSPKLCHLRKWPDFNGYGFNLHAERGKAGQFVGSIDQCSPAQAAGLEIGDRIVEVNGVNIGNENHQQVVQRIKSVPNETKLLVIDSDGDAYYQEKKIVITGNMTNIEYFETPVVNPYVDEPEMPENGDNESQTQKIQTTAAVPAKASSLSPSSSTEIITQRTDFHSVSSIASTASDSSSKSTGLSAAPKQHEPHEQDKNLEFPRSAAEAREQMLKKRNAKATKMSLKDKYDLLQQL